MAAPRKYPLPPTQLRELLTSARREGKSFELAWSIAMRQVKWPYDTTHRREWKAVLEDGRLVWMACYERREVGEGWEPFEELAQAA
jgi:hypothetical protein